LKNVRDLVGRTDLLEHVDYNSRADDHV
jgi:hypothetical protein